MVGEGDKIVAESSGIKRKCILVEGSSKKMKNIAQPKDCELLIPQTYWFPGKVTFYSPHVVIKTLNNKLTETQKQMFKETCFGPYLDLKETVIQAQLIHQLLLRQVKQPNVNELWFNIDDKVVRFSIEEFCLMSGLRCMGNGDFTKYRMRSSTIKEKYFKFFDNISTECVENVFKELPSDTVDKDVVDVGLIYLISSFLFATSYHKSVDDSIFVLVESGEMESFPWGKELYSLTLMSLKGAFSKRIMKLDPSKKFLEYRLNGFLLAFQVWIYESIPAIAEKNFCVKYKPSLPRILSWSSNVHLTSLQLHKRIFDLIKIEVNVVKITDAEKEVSYTDGLFENLKSQGQNTKDDDNSEHPVIHQSTLMITAGDDSSSKLKKKKRHSESNEVILKRLAEIEVKLQSNEEILKRLAEIEAKVESHDVILKRLTDIESKMQSNEEIQNRLAELEIKVQSNIQIEEKVKQLEEKVKLNEEILQRVANVESKVNDLQMLKNGAENVAKDTVDMEKNATDCPSFSLGVEFDSTGKSIEMPVETNVEKTVDEVTPDAPLKRQTKPAAILQSPFVNQYDSTVGTSTAGTSTAKRVVKGTFAFKVGLCPPYAPDVEAFESWYKEGLVTKNKVSHFNDDNIKISPSFYFSDIAISSKIWWYELVTKDEALDDSHMDVCFYYLRKMLRYGNGMRIKATTTDFAFDSQVRGLYEDFSKDPLVLVKQTSLLSYPIGLYMPCNTSWREVDHVLMPLRMYNSAHWLLCHFDIKEMCLNIYNSYTKMIKKSDVLEALEPFSVMIPHLLYNTGFFDGKNISEKEALKPLVVKLVPKLPQQKNDGDCGIYVIKYAEYFINSMLKEMPKTFNIAQIRKYLATELYVYAKKKQVENYDTDNDWVPKDI